MAFVSSVEFNQLATQKIDRKIAFNRDVNVFFGPNGSGKTSLLRILHSALSGKAADLRRIPFARASVEIAEALVFIPDGEHFFGSLTRQTLAETPPPGQMPLSPEMQDSLRAERAGKKIWYTFEPAIEDQSFEIRHTYLPISRLYVNDDRRLPRTLRDSQREVLLSEAALERLFAEIVNFLWLRYTRNTSLEIQERQSNGINEILGHFLAPESEIEQPYEVDTHEAYRRLQAFLGRQPNVATITEAELAKRIKEDKDAAGTERHGGRGG